MSEQPAFEGWAVLELMGHRKLAGYLRGVEIAGAGFLRLDIPSDPPVTQFYSPQAVYGLTPVSEEVATVFSAELRMSPVTRYELPAPKTVALCSCGHPEDKHHPSADDPERACTYDTCGCLHFQPHDYADAREYAGIEDD